MRFHELSLKDKPIFDKFLKIERHNLSTYSFVNIFIWKLLFKISWTILEDNLCVFFKDKISCFMYLTPLGGKKSTTLLDECFKIMDSFNQGNHLSRIENVEEAEVDFYSKLGYNCVYKSSEYLCSKQLIANFRGDKFKSQRASYNRFIRDYTFEYRPLLKKDKQGCLRLYKDWMGQRKNKFTDPVYRGMLSDNLLTQRLAFENFNKLGLLGRVIKINNKISGYTMGFRLSPDTFCILFETTDLKIKGISQFIFREFSKELDYKYINIMDDLGLENLRRLKLSYQPIETIPAYIVQRKDGPKNR